MRTGRPSPLVAVLLCTALGGCGRHVAVTGPDGGSFYASSRLSVAVRANPDNAVSAIVDVTAHRGDLVAVDYGDDAGYAHRTTDFEVPESGELHVPVLGLSPGRTNHFRATAWHLDNSSSSTDDFTLETEPLPADLPAFTVKPGGRVMSGYLLIGLLQFPRNFALAAMVDRAGRLMWYRRSTPSSCGLDFQRQPNGHFTLFQFDAAGFEELDLAGNMVHRWSAPRAPMADGHDLVLLPDDHALLFGRAPRTVDTRAYVDGGVPDALAIESTIEEVDRNGASVFHWDGGERIPLDETDPDIALDPAGFEPLRPDSLALAKDGNLVVSFRNTSSIMKIDRRNGKILWRLGGSRSDFVFASDPQNGFSHQHDARLLDNGDLLLVDNGARHAPPFTRVVQYHLDEASHTATLMWEYRHHPDLYSDEAGSARRLPNGDTVIAWGKQGLVSEIDPFGTVLWEMNVAATTVYRALPVQSIYP